MRILHTSDWHLGQHFYGKSRSHEHQKFLNWLIAQVVDNAIDLVIVAGDIFDTGTPPSYAREMYFDFIVKLTKLDCQLVIVAGNHDSVAMLNESKALLKSLHTRVIPMVSDDQNEQVFVVKNKQQQALGVICAVPFIRPRDVIKSSAGQSSRDKQQSLQEGIVEHYQSLFETAQQLAINDGGEQQLPIIATGHLTTVGVTTSESVREIYIGTLDAFPANAFPSADYIALGHIHRSQKVAKTEHIRYSGSPIPLSFDEASQAKSVLMVTFEGKDLVQVTPINIPRFQPMLMVKTSLDSLIEDVSTAVNKLTLTQESIEQCSPEQDSRKQDSRKLDSLKQDSLEQKSLVLAAKQKVWLDIEISSAEYLHDLHLRIEQLISDLPVEILLVRRTKKARQSLPSAQANVTLDELTLDDVFNERLSQTFSDDEADQQRKVRLKTLFAQVVVEVAEQAEPSASQGAKR